MRRALLLLLAGAAAFALVDLASAQGTAEPPSVRREFALGDSKFAVALPETHANRVRMLDTRVIIDFGKNMRLQRLLIIAREAPRAGGPLGPKQVLASGGRLAYRVEDDTGGGSGGPIAELNGILELDAAEFHVTCTDQSEWHRDPEWCLPILAKIQLVKSP